MAIPPQTVTVIGPGRHCQCDVCLEAGAGFRNLTRKEGSSILRVSCGPAAGANERRVRGHDVRDSPCRLRPVTDGNGVSLPPALESIIPLESHILTSPRASWAIARDVADGRDEIVFPPEISRFLTHWRVHHEPLHERIGAGHVAGRAASAGADADVHIERILYAS